MSLTRVQVAARLGISEASVRRLHLAHKLPFRMEGSVCLTDEGDLEAYEQQLRDDEASSPRAMPPPLPRLGGGAPFGGAPPGGAALAYRSPEYGARRAPDEATFRARILAWLELGPPDQVELRHLRSSDLIAIHPIGAAVPLASVASTLAQAALDDVDGRGGRQTYRLCAEGMSALSLTVAAPGLNDGAEGTGSMGQALALLTERTQQQLLIHVEHTRGLERESRKIDQSSYQNSVAGYERTIAVLEKQLDKALARVETLETRAEETARLREEALNAAAERDELRLTGAATREREATEAAANQRLKERSIGEVMKLAPHVLPPLLRRIGLQVPDATAQSAVTDTAASLFAKLDPDDRAQLATFLRMKKGEQAGLQFDALCNAFDAEERAAAETAAPSAAPLDPDALCKRLDELGKEIDAAHAAREAAQKKGDQAARAEAMARLARATQEGEEIRRKLGA